LTKGGSYDASLAERPFDAYMSRIEDGWLRESVPALLRGAGRYLDFACGTGRITAAVAPFAREAVGVDISPTMLAAAQQKCPGVRFVHADLTRQDVDLGTFDLVTSFRFFGNAQADLREAAMAAIARHVRPGGHLVVNSHRNPHCVGALLQTLGGHAHGMDLGFGKMKRLLAANGLRVRSVRSIGTWVLMARMRTPAILEGRTGALAERMLAARLFAPVAPDCIIVAQRD
jgi:SAM-dependent methyltransferase